VPSPSRARAHRLAHWLPAVAVAGVIAWFSHQPDWPDAAVGWPDWLLHGLAFGGLAVTALWGVVGGVRGLPPRPHQLTTALIIASLYGAADEIHQSFIPGRDAAPGDWAADTAGAALALLLAVPIFAGLRALWDNRHQR
jgi:hypothetical protein